MAEKLTQILLVDDNPDDNFFHQRVVKKYDSSIQVDAFESASEALVFLKSISESSLHPDMIFLDVNMPGMNGWEFLEEFNKLGINKEKNIIIYMLTTSEDQKDIAKSKNWNFVAGFKTKPLTAKILEEIKEKYFNL